MDSLAILTRVRVLDETSEKGWREGSIEEVMQHPISHARFVNVSWLGVIDLESLIGTVSICFRLERLMEINEMIHEMQLKLLDVFFLLLAFSEIFPGQEEILE